MRGPGLLGGAPLIAVGALPLVVAVAFAQEGAGRSGHPVLPWVELVLPPPDVALAWGVWPEAESTHAVCGSTEQALELGYLDATRLEPRFGGAVEALAGDDGACVAAPVDGGVRLLRATGLREAEPWDAALLEEHQRRLALRARQRELRERLLPEAIAEGYAAGGGSQPVTPLALPVAERVTVEAGVLWRGSTEAEIDERMRWFERWVASEARVPDRLRYEDEVRSLVRVERFELDRTEVTQARFEAFVEQAGYRPSGEVLSTAPDHPVVGVTLADAMAFCAAVGQRLPTADEWELAARGPEGRRFPWGWEAPDGTRGNFCDARCPYPWGTPEFDDGHEDLAPVGSYPGGATPAGLLDLAGNAREWTSTLADAESALVKGGGYHNAYEDLLPADVRRNPWHDTHGIGFRCAASSE
jgi:formylglycine-generating enzyme required for sulfatase activity